MASAVETAAEFLDHGSNDVLHEIVDGRPVEKPPMGVYSTYLVSRLMQLLGSAVDVLGTGWVVSEMLFDLGSGSTRRRPDVAYVSFSRWPESRPMPASDPWNVVPELAVEVVSPNNGSEEIHDKVIEYLSRGVLLVWVIYPKQKCVDVFDGSEVVKRVTEQGTLDGGEAIPGLRVPLPSLFRTRND